MSNTGEAIPYNEMPVYNAHFDGVTDDKHIILVNSSGISLDIDLTNVADGTLKINSTDYYTKAKVDELLTALETRVKKYADDKDTEVKQWASTQFAPKA